MRREREKEKLPRNTPYHHQEPESELLPLLQGSQPRGRVGTAIEEEEKGEWSRPHGGDDDAHERRKR